MERIIDLEKINNLNFNLQKLIKICKEINNNWENKNYYSLIALVRIILDHIPPIFGLNNFSEVANNYSGGRSFKKSMSNLLNSSKNIADNHLHSQVQKKEVLPTPQQVDYRNDLDLLLSEIIKTLS